MQRAYSFPICAFFFYAYLTVYVIAQSFVKPVFHFLTFCVPASKSAFLRRILQYPRSKADSALVKFRILSDNKLFIDLDEVNNYENERTDRRAL